MRKPNVETEQTEQTKFVMGQSVMVRESLLAGRIQGIYPIQPGDKERAYTVVGKDKNGGLVYMRFYESELTPNVETERYKFEIGQPVMTPRIAGRIHAIHPVMHGDSERRYTVSGKDGHDTTVYMQFFESDIQPI